MNSVFPFNKPLVIGHRGASVLAPENTLASFRLALDQGADGIELDARLTRDRVVMILHDAGVERVSQGTGRMSKLTRVEIQRLDAGSRFGPAFRGERIPTLEEVFTAFGDRPVYDLEIKNFDAPGNGLEQKVLELVCRFGLQQRVMITSFNPLAVRFFRRELPQAPTGLLFLAGGAGRLEETLLNRWASYTLTGLAFSGLSAAFIARQKSRAVLVWGVQTADEVLRAVQLGAAGVIADDPGMVRRTLQEA